MSFESWIGRILPDVSLAELRDGKIHAATASEFFVGAKVVAMGVPGAFTPVCTNHHVPDYVATAEMLRASGFEQVLCIAPNDPFVLAKWAHDLDPERKLRFLSDGNLDFTRRLGLVSMERDLFLGERSMRYMLIAENGRIRHLRAERSVLDYSCTRSNEVMMVA